MRARPLIQDLRRLGEEAAPATKSLDQLTASLDETEALQRINDFVYYLALATNGFDSVGHYLRAGLVTNNCSNYVLRPSASAGACLSLFYDPLSGPASASTEARNAKFDESKIDGKGSVTPQGTLLQGLLGSPSNEEQTRQRDQGLERLRDGADGKSPALQNSEPMLDYLLGGEG
jgi:hypothetical protein